MDNYESIVELINANKIKINFGDFGQGVSDLWIEKAQKRLNVVFPPSYIWWLKNYSGGEILGEEIFSVYELNFDTVIGGDVVYMNELNRRNKLSDNTQLVIQETDRAEIFYFDLLQIDKNGEYPVVRAFADIRFKYADNFLGFLRGRIMDRY